MDERTAGAWIPTDEQIPATPIVEPGAELGEYHRSKLIAFQIDEGTADFEEGVMVGYFCDELDGNKYFIESSSADGYEIGHVLAWMPIEPYKAV